MQRVPELAGRDLTLTRAVRRHHEPQLPRRARPAPPDRWVIRLAGNDTHLLGISREVEHAATVAAAGRRRRPRGHRVHPARGLPRHPVHRGPPVSDEAVHQPETLARVADSLRRIHDGPPIPGLFVPVPDRGGVPRARRRPRRPDPAGVRARPGGRPADRARAALAIPSSCGRATTTCSTRTSSTTGSGSGSSTGSTRGWATRSSTSATSRSTTSLSRGRGSRAPGRVRRAIVATGSARPAHADADDLRLPGGDVGRPPAGDQHARRRLRRLRRRALRPAAGRRDDATLRAVAARGGAATDRTAGRNPLVGYACADAGSPSVARQRPA